MHHPPHPLQLQSPLLGLLLGAALATGAIGCERDKAAPPEPSEADAPWQTLVAELDDDRLTVHQKLRALDDFAARYLDHPYEQELARRRGQVERDVEADFAAQASRARTYAEEQAAARKRRREAVEAGSLAGLAGEVLFSFAPWNDAISKDGFEPVTLVAAPRPPRVLRAPFEDAGMATLRQAAVALIAETAPDLAREGGYQERHERTSESFNLLLRGRLGSDLFDPDRPGALDPAALDRLLAEIYVDPDAPLLGARARDVYRLFRPIVWDYARVYLVLDQRVGRRALVAAQRRGLRAHGESDMIPFYEGIVEKHDVVRRAKLSEPWGASVITGFWMRRAADGTDRALVTFLRKVARAYDPELAALL